MSGSNRVAVGILGIILAGCASQPHPIAAPPPAKPAPAPVQPPPSPMEQIVKALKARATDGDMSAATCLGGMYMDGLGVGQDIQQAGTYIGQANGQNYPLAEVLEAVLVTRQPEFSLYVRGAEKQVEDLAKQGNPAAETYMGIQTRYGSHLIQVKGDLAASAHWLQLAAAQDDAYGEAELAAAYKHGWGVPQDPALAQQWFEKAAHHSFDCVADYVRVAQSLVQANVTYPQTLLPSVTSEQVLLRLPLNGAADVQPSVLTSSGNAAFDAAALAAVGGLPLPTWTAAPKDVRDFAISINFSQMSVDPTSNYPVQEWQDELSTAIYRESDVLWGQNPYRTQAQGMTLVGLEYKDGKLGNVKVLQSSGDAVLDAHGMKAVESASLPPVPPILAGQLIHLSYWISDSWDSSCFEDPADEPHSAYATKVRAAICKSEVAPRHALLFGSSGSGITAVSFDIRGGKADHIRVTRSSGDAEVDKAAVDAVRHAHLPPMPAGSAKRSLHITTHVIFEVGSTTAAPAAVTASGPGL